MKKIVLFFILIVCLAICNTRTFAQSLDSLQVVVNKLSIKVTSLEQDLIALKIESNIKTLDAEINIASLGIESVLNMAITSNKDMINYLKKRYHVYKQQAELIADEMESLQRLVNSNIESLSATVNYRISTQLLFLINSYDLLQQMLSNVEKALYMCD